MHLWPSVRMRESFKKSSISNYERNLHRMRKAQAQSERKSDPSPSFLTALVACCVGILLPFLTCCFCFGACHDEEEK